MVEVSLAALRKAGNAWDEQSDIIHSAARNFSQAEVALLGQRVASAAGTFVAVWFDELDVIKREAISHATALTEASLDFAGTDTAVRDQMRGLLPVEARERPLFPGAGQVR